MNVRGFVFWLIAVLLVGLGLCPLVDIFAQTLFVNGRFSLDLFRNLFASAHTRHLLITSLSLAGLVTLLSLLVGLPFGILLGKSDVPGRTLLVMLFTVPLLIPPYVQAVAWFHLLGRQGWVARWLGGGDWKAGSDFLFGLGGCAWILFSCYMPILMLLTIAFIRSVNPRLEEAALLVTSWPRVLSRITLPLILPGIILGMLLIFLLTLGEFGVPLFLRVNVFPVETFTQFSAYYDFGAAAAAAVPLALIALVAMLAEGLFLEKKTVHVRIGPVESSGIRMDLGKWGKWITGADVVLRNLHRDHASPGSAERVCGHPCVGSRDIPRLGQHFAQFGVWCNRCECAHHPRLFDRIFDSCARAQELEIPGHPDHIAVCFA